MLLKIERAILRKTSSRKDFQIHISELGKYHGEDVYQAFLTLKEKGYFSLVDSAVGHSNFSYVLTPKGKYYKEHLRLEFLKKYPDSIHCCPRYCYCHVPFRESGR